MSSPSSWMDKIKAELKSEHLEVSLRMSFAMLLGYVFTFVSLPSLVPIDTNIVLGLLVPFCTMLFPTLTFTVGSIILPLFGLFFFLFLSSSLLLAIAVSGGTGPFICAYAILSFWVCFTRFDKVEGNKTSIILIGVVFQTILIWPTFITVQEGIILPNSYMTQSMEKALMGFVADAIEVAKELGSGTHFVDITTGVLAGRTAEITILSDGDSKTKIEGGMWIVKAAWTFSGMQNPLASYKNMTICVCWIALFLSIAVLAPPFRTMRSAIWRGILPGALKDAAQSIRLNSARMNNIRSTDASISEDLIISNEDTCLEDSVTDEAARLATRGRCVFFLTTLYGGSLAQYTAFEPRILNFKQPKPTVETLVKLCSEISRCVRIAVGIDLFMEKNDNSAFLQENIDEYDKIATVLEYCAQALFTADSKLLDKVEFNSMSGSDTASDPFRFGKVASNVVELSKKWLEEMSDKDAEGIEMSPKIFCTNTWKVITPFINAQLSVYLFLFKTILKIFTKSSLQALVQKQFYSLPKFIWCVKYAFGMTTLIVILVAWPQYRENFVVASSKDDPLWSRYGPQNASWVIVAYCFATTQTAEGSVKKGILRMIGTIVGAFSGWLALLVCEDGNYEYDYNTYSIVAWLSITSFVAVYISTERGFAARVSLSNDYAFGPIYFVITEIIIIFYGYFIYGPESRNAITLNRMLSNLVGIAFGILLAIIPPAIYGGDPGHCKSIVSFYRESLIEVLQMLLSDEIDEYDTAIAAEVKYNKIAKKLMENREKNLLFCKTLQETAIDFEKDASKLKIFPWFKVDQKLKAEISKVTRDIHIAAFVHEHTARMLLDPEKRQVVIGENSRGREELEFMLLKLQGRVDFGETTGRDVVIQEYESSESELDLELLLRTLNWLAEEIKMHEKVLDGIKWGF